MSVETIGRKVQAHFHADAQRFDAIYEEEKSAFARFVDNVWRGVVKRRLDLALQVLNPLAGKTVIDVGCGSGRYCFAYAEKGAKRVLGVDFAEGMIDLANQHNRKLALTAQCEFRTGAFPAAAGGEKFDASTAMGFFDYIADPVYIISEMRKVTRETMVMSFPKRWEWRIPIRRLRFLKSGCPLFLYTEKSIRKIMAEAGVTRYELINFDRDYVVVAHLK